MEEQNKTYTIIKYILIFFLVIALVGGSFLFFYTKYIQTKSVVKIDNTKIIDDDFKNIADSLKEKKDEIKIGDKVKPYVKRDCYIDDISVKSGEKVKLYSRRVVSPFEDCKNFMKERVCLDGEFLGDKKFKYSKCEKNLDCQLPTGEVIKNNQSIKLYSRKSVPYGETCERYAQERKCKDTILTGDKRYIYKNCYISYDNSCDAGNGNILKNNYSYTVYSKNKVPYGKKCADFSKKIFCRNTVIEGADISVYKYFNCVEEEPKPCYIDGHKIEHSLTKTVTLYSKKYSPEGGHGCDWYSAEFKCVNGVLSNDEGYTTDEYKYYDCDKI